MSRHVVLRVSCRVDNARKGTDSGLLMICKYDPRWPSEPKPTARGRPGLPTSTKEACSYVRAPPHRCPMAVLHKGPAITSGALMLSLPPPPSPPGQTYQQHRLAIPISADLRFTTTNLPDELQIPQPAPDAGHAVFFCAATLQRMGPRQQQPRGGRVRAPPHATQGA